MAEGAGFPLSLKEVDHIKRTAGLQGKVPRSGVRGGEGEVAEMAGVWGAASAGPHTHP